MRVSCIGKEVTSNNPLHRSYTDFIVVVDEAIVDFEIESVCIKLGADDGTLQVV
jgi:hypothetical protein